MAYSQTRDCESERFSRATSMAALDPLQIQRTSNTSRLRTADEQYHIDTKHPKSRPNRYSSATTPSLNSSRKITPHMPVAGGNDLGSRSTARSRIRPSQAFRRAAMRAIAPRQSDAQRLEEQ
jgi:hypothetical protein